MEIVTVIYLLMFFFGIFFLSLFVLLTRKYFKKINYYPEPKIFPSITLLVPAYNEESCIEATIKSLVSVEYPVGKKEIILINDGSKDNTLKIMRDYARRYPEITVLDKINSGKANSLNEGIKMARGELIAVVDADSCPAKDSLHKMVGFFEEDEKVAAVTSRVLVKRNKNFIEKFQDFDYIVIAWDRKILDFINCVYVTNGPLSVYRTKIVRKIGGFNPKVITEDIEITWNLLSKGYKTKMAFQAIAYTGIPDTFKRWNLQRIRWNLGGFQTIWKYRQFFFRGENLFGYFVIQYILFSFLLALLGLILSAKTILLGLWHFILISPYFSQGFNPFYSFNIDIELTLISVVFLIFLVLAIGYYLFALKKSGAKHIGIGSILVYIFVYRTLYIVPLIGSIYKLIKGDIGWYTK